MVTIGDSRMVPQSGVPFSLVISMFEKVSLDKPRIIKTKRIPLTINLNWGGSTRSRRKIPICQTLVTGVQVDTNTR